MRRTVPAALILLLALRSEHAVAEAEDLERGERAYAQHDLTQAAEAFDGVLHSASATRTEIATALAGIAAVSHERHDGVTRNEAIETAVRVDPAVHAIPGSPAGMEELLRQSSAAQLVRMTYATMQFAASPIAGRPSVLHIALSRVPHVLPMRLSVRCASEGSVVAHRDEPARDGTLDVLVDTLAPNTAVDCVASLLTASGVAVERRTAHADVIDPNEAVMTSESEQLAERRGPHPALVAGIIGGAVLVSAAVIVLFLATGQTTTASLGPPVATSP